MQILEWIGGLYLDFLGLSGEICFFLVLFYLGRVMCKSLPTPKQDPSLEVLLHINAISVRGERTVHAGEGF